MLVVPVEGVDVERGVEGFFDPVRRGGEDVAGAGGRRSVRRNRHAKGGGWAASFGFVDSVAEMTARVSWRVVRGLGCLYRSMAASTVNRRTDRVVPTFIKLVHNCLVI